MKSVDTKAKKVTTDKGDTIGYDKLILATGSGVSAHSFENHEPPRGRVLISITLLLLQRSLRS